MDNPLNKFFDVEERDEGLYIKVPPEKTPSINVDIIKKELSEAGVVNYDMDKISSAVSKATGKFEFVGETFKYSDGKAEKYMQVENGQMEAFLTVSSAIIPEHIDLTTGVILDFLKQKGITHGINSDILEQFVQKPEYDKKISVAAGTPPQKGKDAEIIMETSIKSDTKPHAKGSGTGQVDFKDIRTFNTVTQGDLIAKRLPPTQGRDGIAVTGEKIEAQYGKDTPLPRGKNTVIKDDKLFAAKTGIVYKEGGLINIKELLEIKKNVDYSTGNIKYSGDVYIRGNVKPGFSVESEGDIFIGGEAERARIFSRNGYVTVKKGIFGKGETEIFGKHGVNICFAQEAEIASEGTVTIEKYILNCKCKCNTLTSKTPEASIIGGDTRVYKYIEIGNMGNNKRVDTKATIINKEAYIAEAKINKLKQLKKQLSVEMQPLQKEIKHKSSMLKKVDKKHMNPKVKAQLAEIVNSYSKMKSKLEYIDNMIAELKEKMESPSGLTGYIFISNTAYPNVEINLYNIRRKKIQVSKNNVRMKIEGDGKSD